MSSTPPPTGPGPQPAGRLARERRHRWGRVALVLVGVAAIVAIVVLDRHTLAQSLSAIGNIDLRWFALAICCEAVSLTAFGLSRRRLLQADGHKATFGSVMAITYAGNALSMSVPFAGAQLAAVFSYRQFRRRGLDPALTGWALGISAIASSSALALILVVGALAGGAPLATAFGFLGAAVFALPAITVILALRYPRARAVANRIVTWAVHLVRRIVHKPVIEAETLDGFLERLGTITLPWPRYGEVSGLAVVNWLADCACLACAIRATGQPIPWHGLLLAYGAGAIAGSTGVTPGGFVIVEAALTAALVGAGMGAGRALGAVLAYRLVNFWMILLGGGIVLVVLTKLSGRIRQYQRIQPLATAGGGIPSSPAGGGTGPGGGRPGTDGPAGGGPGGGGPAGDGRETQAATDRER